MEAIRCPYCRQEASNTGGCAHQRWSPQQGEPVDFAMFVMETSQYSESGESKQRSIPRAWWEEHFDWLLERIRTRFDVNDGYCFGEIVDLDRLRIDIRNRFAATAASGPAAYGPAAHKEGA